MNLNLWQCSFDLQQGGLDFWQGCLDFWQVGKIIKVALKFRQFNYYYYNYF